MTTTAISHNLSVAHRCVQELEEHHIEVLTVSIPERMNRKPVITIDSRHGHSARFLHGAAYKRFHHGGHTTETHAADYKQCQIEWQTQAGA